MITLEPEPEFCREGLRMIVLSSCYRNHLFPRFRLQRVVVYIVVNSYDLFDVRCITQRKANV